MTVKFTTNYLHSRFDWSRFDWSRIDWPLIKLRTNQQDINENKQFFWYDENYTYESISIVGLTCGICNTNFPYLKRTSSESNLLCWKCEINKK